MDKEASRLLQAKIPGPETGIEIKRTLCDICCPGTHCGIDAYVKDGVVLKVEGTKEHPLNHGKLCTKGAASRQYIYRADRLKTPMRRIGQRGEGKFEPITWDEAYGEIVRQLNLAKAEYGTDSVAFYSGYTKWYRQFLHRFAYSFGSINYGSECSSCWKATEMAWMSTAGTIADPDMAGANTILGWALNSFHSSHLAGPRLLALKDQGKKFIIIDPRKTPATAKLADIHLQIKPGTDGALALGMAKLIIDNGWADMDYIEQYTYGFDRYAEYVSTFDLDTVAAITDLSPGDIEGATALYATNGPACIHESASPVTHHINGFQNYRAIICLNALTGNFDRAGGNVPVEATYYDQVAGYRTREHQFYLDRQPGDKKKAIGASRFPLWNRLVDEFQAMDLSRQIIEGTPYPIKAVFGMGMNAKMFPDTEKMYQALEKLDFFCQSELFMTDTAKYADILLPACTSFERGEFKAYPGGYAAFTSPIIDRVGDSKSDVEMLADLAVLLDLDDELLRSGYDAGLEFMLQDLSVSIDDMKASDLPIHVPEARDPLPGEYLAGGIKTPTGKFEFYSTIVEEYEMSHGLNPISTYREPLEDETRDEEYPFILNTGSRLPHTLHSRLHDVPWLRTMGKQPKADISTEDAKRLGIQDGDRMEIENRYGKVTVEACPSVKIKPGQVHLYHGYREANANSLVGADHLDPYSGFPGYKSNRCTIRPVKNLEEDIK